MRAQFIVFRVEMEREVADDGKVCHLRFAHLFSFLGPITLLFLRLNFCLVFRLSGTFSETTLERNATFVIFLLKKRTSFGFSLARDYPHNFVLELYVRIQ